MNRGSADLEALALDCFGRGDRDGLSAVVREAYQRGGEIIAGDIADAYALHLIANDDPASFRDALAELIPPGWILPDNRT